MTQNEKAIANLKEKGVYAHEENGTVYIHVNEYPFEIAIFEIEYQRLEYDEKRTEGQTI